MAMSMADIVAGLKDDVVKGIVLQFVRQNLVFQKISFVGTDSFVTKTWELETVTDAVWRSIGESFSETKDKFKEQFEGIYLMGGQIDIDTALLLPGQKEIDAYAENIALQSKRYMYGFMEAFINGDRATNPETFDGLKTRIEAIGGDQVIAGGSLDLSASSANRQTFLDYMHRGIEYCGDPGPDLILTSRRGKLALTSVARREGLYDVGRDMFDRKIDMFAGIPVMWAGTKGDQSTEIIPVTETAAGARTGGSDTSYYFVQLGHPYVQGMQMRPPQRLYDGVISDGVTRRVVFQWPVGLRMSNNRAVVRLRGITANVG